MPRSPNRQMDLDDDPRLNELEQEVIRTKTRNDLLERQLAEQTDLSVMESQEWDLPGLQVLPFSQRPELFLQMLVWLILGRAIVFGFVEKWGTAAGTLGIATSFLFGLCAIWLLYSWAKSEWNVNEWLIVPRAILVFVGLVISINVLTDGGAWQRLEDVTTTTPAPSTEVASADKGGEVTGTSGTAVSAPEGAGTDTTTIVPAEKASRTSTIWALCVGISFLLLAASSYCSFSLFKVQRILDHPVIAFRSLRRKSRDTRRKD